MVVRNDFLSGRESTADAAPRADPPAMQPQIDRPHRLNPLMHPAAWIVRAIRDENVFLFLLGVRWLSLLPPALMLLLHPAAHSPAPLVFTVALLNNLLLTVFHPQLNRLVLRAPMILVLDMMLAATFISLVGGINSPYELYGMTPILAAAFFFQIRGGLLAAAAFTIFYLLALASARGTGGPPVDVNDVHEALTQIFSFFLAGLIFGYPSILLKRLHAATTQLQCTQQELVRAESLAAIGKMASHVSHEIRNPLTTVGGFARSMVRKPNDAERVQTNAQIIVDEVQRLEQFLTDMLDFTRPPKLNLRPEDPHCILDKAWLLAGGVPGEGAAVTICKDYDPNLHFIQADASSLMRAFINVIRNAIQVMPQGGTVMISTRLLDDEVRITIADTGSGIEPDVLPTIFTPFVTHREHGTGLGLAVTQQIIHEHHGHIEVHTEVGKGTQFIFHFPLAPAAP
jgi:signal transduction histidine kinase